MNNEPWGSKEIKASQTQYQTASKEDIDISISSEKKKKIQNSNIHNINNFMSFDSSVTKESLTRKTCTSNAEFIEGAS